MFDPMPPADDGDDDGDDKLPGSFTFDLAAVLMKTRGEEKITLEWLVRKYTDDTYEVVEEAEDEDAALPQAILENSDERMVG